MTTRPIPGWPGYHVDDDGRVYTTRCRVHIGGLTWAPSTGGKMRELRQFDRKTVKGETSPYLSVALHRDGRTLNRYVHELVALAFLGPRPDGYEILHGREGSRCNALRNLRYGTPEENSAERALPRGADWYRKRGLRPPEAALSAPAPPVTNDHAFADLITSKEGTAA